MSTMDRLKELNATTGKRNGDEDLGHWADREKRENMWVRDVALPDLLAVAEAAGELFQWDIAGLISQAGDDPDFDDCKKVVEMAIRLDAALAKLEGEV